MAEPKLTDEERQERFVMQYGSIVTPSCMTCKWRSEVDLRLCVAFPKGIPLPILRAEHDHMTPYEGDHGVLYEKKAGTS